MTPIHELLARIRWDPAFGRGRFELTYEDKRDNRQVRIPLDRIHVKLGQHFAFEVTDPEGNPVMVPMHRVRAVWRDGVQIWSRHVAAGRGGE
jgi:uncharacterized protein (UPF0248 family)